MYPDRTTHPRTIAAWVRRLLPVPLALLLAAAAHAASLTFVSPTQNARLPSRTVSLHVTAEGFTPGEVFFYRTVGAPGGGWVDAFLGSAYRGSDGGYRLTSQWFDDGGPYLVYAQAMRNNAPVRADVSFTVDRRTGPTGLVFTQPENNATVHTPWPAFRAVAVNFKPDYVDFYQTFGTPDDTIDDRLLGRAYPEDDGSFRILAEHKIENGGPYLIYAQYHDGFNRVRGTVSIRVDARQGLTLTLSPNTITACSSGEAQVTLIPAPLTNATVALSSNSPLVTVPATVVIRAGENSARVPFTAAPVRANTSVTLKATYADKQATATVTVQPYPRPPYEYTVEDLGTLGGSYSVATGINADGQVVGYATLPSGLIHAFRTGPYGPNGPLTDLAPGSPDEIVAWDVNDAGQIAGYRRPASGPQTAIRIEPDGVIRPLTTVAQAPAQGLAINNAGQVAGWMTTDGSLRAFRTNSGGALTDLGLMANGSRSYARGLNDQGRVVGTADSNEFPFGFRTSGAGGVASADALGAYVYPYDINGTGYVTGEAWDFEKDHYNLFRARPDGTVQMLGRLGEHPVTGTRINNRNVIVGTAYIEDPEGGNAFDRAAVIHTDARGLRDLNTLIPPGSGWELFAANDINDAGQIVGYGRRGESLRAYRLTPLVPDVLYGDADGNGLLEMNDVATLLRIAGGMEPVGNLLVCDVAPAPVCTPRGFGDGLVTIADAVRVARRLAGLEPVWP